MNRFHLKSHMKLRKFNVKCTESGILYETDQRLVDIMCFYSATHCPYAERCNSYGISVRPSVRQTLVPYPNE